MMNSNCEFTGPCNIGNPTELSMIELAETIIKLTNSKSKLIYEPLPQDDPIQRKPIIELAKKELGWNPTINLERGLTHTIDYFRKIL